MRKFRVGDKVKYVGTQERFKGKQFTVMETRDDFTDNSIKLKEVPEQGFFVPDVFILAKPISLENK